MPKVTVVLTGDKKLNRRLAKLTSKDAKKAIRKSVRPALKPVLQQARNNAKAFKQTGQLQKSIKIRSLKRSRTRVGARVTTGTNTSDFQGKTYYGAFIEYGWKAGKVKRPVAGRHYMRRAADTKKQEAARIYRQKLKQVIKDLAKG